MSAAANYLVDLSKLMVTVYNRAELKGLCDHLEVNFDELRDAGIVEQVRELTLLMARRERLPELLATLRADRPNTDWPPVPPDFRLPASLAAPYPASRAAGSSRGSIDYDSRQHRLNQENVTANVRSAYIDGILREALPERVRIALALDTPAQALRRTMRLVVGPEPRSLESAADVAALFKESGRALLILGAPGAGKTITLLELCEPLLRRAADDPAEPVPVVLNLSTWAQKQAPLEAWIIEEMNRQYGLSKKVTPRWLEADHLVLLLDGLDEVAADARDACVRAINTFRETHGAGMAVCSRSADYAELVERLNLSRAVEIQPLTPAQIDAYLSDERLQLAAVRQAIAADDALRELATTPLMLNVMAVAYRGRPYSELLPRLDSPDERRAHIYDLYIERVFADRPLGLAAIVLDDAASRAEVGYTPAEALRWLRFIADQLTRRDKTQFFIEDLDFFWLSELKNLWFIYLGFCGGVGVILGCILSVILVIMFSVTGSRETGIGILIGGFIGGALSVGAAVFNIEPIDELDFGVSLKYVGQIPQKILWYLLEGMIFIVLFLGLGFVVYELLGMVIGALSSLPSSKFNARILSTLTFALGGMLIGGCWSVISAISASRDSFEMAAQDLSRKALKSLGSNILKGLLVGVFFSIVSALTDSYERADELFSFVYNEPFPLLEAAGIITLAILFISSPGVITETIGLFVRPVQTKQRTYPNEGIHRTVKNMLRLAVIIGIIGAFLGGLLGRLVEVINPNLQSGVLYGASAGISIGVSLGIITYGGYGIFSHYLLRLFMQITYLLPLRLIPFLEAMRRRILIQRAGAHYRFIHRTFQEHVAALSDERIDELADLVDQAV